MPPDARPYHHGNLRAALLEAAERALLRDGAAALSLRELAREVGVSHAAPRRHFADKQALLDALAEHGFRTLGDELEAAARPPRPFVPRLTAVARAYMRFATGRAALLDVMYEGKHRPGAAPALLAAGERTFAAPLAVIAEAQAAGEVVPGDPAEVSLAVWAAIHGLAGLAAADMLGPDADLDALAAATVERLVTGLRPR